MLDITPAGRIGPVEARVAFRGRAEKLLPAPAALQLVGVLHGMACLMAENGHALGPGAALDVEDHFLLELHQARIGKIEGYRNARHACRTEPLARYPCVWPQPDAALFELAIEGVETILEPSALDGYPQTAEAVLEQSLVRELFPGMFLPARHRYLDVMAIRCPDRVTGYCGSQPPRHGRRRSSFLIFRNLT